MSSNRRRLLRLLICLLAPIALYAQTAVHGGCGEIPRQDALPFLCAPATSEILAQEEPDSVILLNLPRGTTLRVAVDEKVRIAKPGQAVSATVTEPVYAFDQTVIPAGSAVTGRVTDIDAVPAKKKVLSYVNGNFSPSHGYDLEFDSVILPGGERRKIATSVSPGIVAAVHLVAGGANAKKRNAAAREAQNAKQEAENRVHDTLDEIKAPGKMHRLKEMVLRQSPYRRQYLEPGTRFYVSLTEQLDFG